MLRPYFPNLYVMLRGSLCNPDAKFGRGEILVMRHYLLKTVHVIMAFECPRNPWNPWLVLHASLAFQRTPKWVPSVWYDCRLTLASSSNAAEAIRHAILAVGAVHLRFTCDSNDKANAWRLVANSKRKVFGFVKKALDEQGSTLSDLEIDMVLGALLSCTIASVSLAPAASSIS